MLQISVFHLLTVTSVVSDTGVLSNTYGLSVASVTLTEHMYSPLSAVTASDTVNCGAVSLTAFDTLCLLSGVVQLEWMNVGVSTEGGWMEQVTERSEPDTTVSSLAVTVTTGLGTEGERKRVQGFKDKHMSLTFHQYICVVTVVFDHANWWNVD